MPQIKSSIKSMKKDAAVRAQNFATKSAVKTANRKVAEAAQAGKAEEATALFTDATKKLDTAARKGIIHKNAVARKKSRLANKVNEAAK